MDELVGELLQPFVGTKIEIVMAPESTPVIGIVERITTDEFGVSNATVYLEKGSVSPRACASLKVNRLNQPYVGMELVGHNESTKAVKQATFNGKTLHQLMQANMAEAQAHVVDERKRCAALRDDLASAAKDCTVVAKDNQLLPSNKALLSGRSPVFAAMFRTDMKEKKMNKVDMSSHSPEAVKVFLQLLSGMSDGLQAELLPDLVDLFEMYQVKNLVAVLGRHQLMTMLTVENAADVFFKAGEYERQTELLDLISVFIAKNQAAVMDTEAWKGHIEKGLSGVTAKALLAAQTAKP